MMRIYLLLLLFPLVCGVASARPNILWITSEDNSPYLGCYGDPLAATPNLDKLAAGGVRYRNAFANAPVCSAARSTLITGMYATSLGIQHHRGKVPIPRDFKLYYEQLQKAGYYCTNHTKTDYNFPARPPGWDDGGKNAHYRNRKPGQPFFAVFNLMTSHEGRAGAKPGKNDFRVSPDKIKLPPYHPDTRAIRRDWANYYDQMTAMDLEVGALLDELEREGLADDTIVFYYGDHGGALPRGKRNIHDSGTRVPLIIRIPEKLAKLAPVKAGGWVDEFVSLVDLPPTVFSLCGIRAPENYQGRAFLGPAKAAPRDHVFLFRDRMDERYDMVRSIRGRDFQYIRNYSPHRPWGQHYSYPFGVLPSMGSWHDEYKAGRCNPVQAAFWEAKPGEEIYKTSADPFQIRNLAADPAQNERLAAMRATLHAELLATRDTGFIPEGMFRELAGGKTIYDYARSSAYPLERILTIAGHASDGDPARLPELSDALADRHPVVRYWAATGCLILREKAAPAKERLRELLQDDSLDVRVVAAEAISWLGESERAAAALKEVIGRGNAYEILAAQNSVDYLLQAGHIALADARRLVGGGKLREPLDRIPAYLMKRR